MVTLLLTALLAGGAGKASVPSVQQPSAVAFVRVTVVDVERGALVPDQTVVVEGNRISVVGPSQTTSVPARARQIDGRGKFLIPGLWDMHVHAATPWFGEYFMPLMVAHGVTAVRDMFTTAEAVAEWRRRVTSGQWHGPRVAAFGQLVDGAPPIWPGSVVATTPDDGIRIVDSMKAAGATFVKVYSRLLPETFRAIAERSKAVGIPFAGHVPSLVRPEEAARLGMQTIEHLQQAMQGCSAAEEETLVQSAAAVRSPKAWDSAGRLSREMAERVLASFDADRCRALGRAFAASGTWMVPTFTVLRSISKLDDSTLAADSRLAYIPGFLKSGWDPKVDFRFRMLTSADWARRRLVYARQLEIARIFREVGVRFVAGTDLANPHIFPGSSLHDELAIFVSVGFTPSEALRAATSEPARLLGMSERLGTIAAGKLADLVLLDADPLEDIENVRRVAVVVADGRVLDAVTRERIMAEALERARKAPAGR
ncbi:MAG: amidohydrolase family protein [Gemmatimonadetes bacterium]|nr:amidohydrolase family protein [Gemmatimonadota bacterium]